MALRSQPVPLVLSGGLDRKIDKNIVVPGRLSAATDVEFDDANTIIQRAGLSQRVVNGTPGIPVRMFGASDPVIEVQSGAQVLATSNTSALIGANTITAAGLEPSTFPRFSMDTRRIETVASRNGQFSNNPVQDSNFDAAQDPTSGTYVVGVEERQSTGLFGTRFTLYNAAGSVLVDYLPYPNPTVITLKPRVIYDGNGTYYCFYAKYVSAALSYTVEYFTLTTGGGSTAPALLNTITGTGAVEGATGIETMFDVAFTAGVGFCFAARSTTALTAVMRLYNTTLGPLTALTNINPAAAMRSLTCGVQLSGGLVTGYVAYGSANTLKMRRLNTTPVLSAEVTVYTAGGAQGVGRSDIVPNGSTLSVICDVYDTSTTRAFTDLQAFLTITEATLATTTTNTQTTRGWICGRSFLIRTGLRVIPVLFTSLRFQSVILLVNATDAYARAGTPGIVARLDPGECRNQADLVSAHCDMRVPGCSAALLPYLKYETNTRLAGTANVTSFCLAMASFTDGQLGDVDWNGDQYLAGALPLVYDGAQIVEENFHWAPEIQGATVTAGVAQLTPVATGTGLYDFPAVGTFTVAFTMSWQDSKGNWHESGTSLTGKVTTTVGNLAINPTVVQPPSLKRTQKLTMYRTLDQTSNANTTLYLAHTYDLGAGAGYVSDAQLASGEPLYTEGGILPNSPMPSCHHIAKFQNRLVLSGCGDGTRIFWSKEKASGFAAEFIGDDLAFQQILPQRCSGTQEMDGRLIVALENGVGVIGGTGPLPTGVGGSYSSMETVVKDIGCSYTAPKSITLSVDGVWFQSRYGLRLVSRSGSLAVQQDGKQVGSEVDDLVSGNLVAIAGGSQQQVRFFTQGEALVFDSTWKQFSQFTGQTNVDACAANGTYYLTFTSKTSQPFLQYYNTAALQDTNEDGVVTINSYVATSWLSFANLMGFQRVSWLNVLGTCTGQVTTTLGVGYDFVETISNEITTNVTNIGTKLEFAHQFARQKCESMRLAVSFRQLTPSSRIRLTGFNFVVGVKKSSYRYPGAI